VKLATPYSAEIMNGWSCVTDPPHMTKWHTPVAGPNINWINKSTTYIIEILVLFLVVTPTTNHIDCANVGYCMVKICILILSCY